MTEATLLHRQIHPAWIQNGRVTSQAFKPTPKEAGLLSVYDGDRISAEAAWKHFTAVLKFLSVGALAVTVHQCAENELPVHLRPEEFPEHVIIDSTPFSGNQIEKKAKKLRTAAETRGWQHRAM